MWNRAGFCSDDLVVAIARPDAGVKGYRQADRKRQLFSLRHKVSGQGTLLGCACKSLLPWQCNETVPAKSNSSRILRVFADRDKDRLLPVYLVSLCHLRSEKP